MCLHPYSTAGVLTVHWYEPASSFLGFCHHYKTDTGKGSCSLRNRSHGTETA